MAKIEAVMLARGTSVLLVVLYLFASMLLSLSRKKWRVEQQKWNGVTVTTPIHDAREVQNQTTARGSNKAEAAIDDTIILLARL